MQVARVGTLIDIHSYIAGDVTIGVGAAEYAVYCTTGNGNAYITVYIGHLVAMSGLISYVQAGLITVTAAIDITCNGTTVNCHAGSRHVGSITATVYITNAGAALVDYVNDRCTYNCGSITASIYIARNRGHITLMA